MPWNDILAMSADEICRNSLRMILLTRDEGCRSAQIALVGLTPIESVPSANIAPRSTHSLTHLESYRYPIAQNNSTGMILLQKNRGGRVPGRVLPAKLALLAKAAPRQHAGGSL